MFKAFEGRQESTEKMEAKRSWMDVDAGMRMIAFHATIH